MIVATPVDPGGQVGHTWGRARQVGVAEVSEGNVVRWEVHDVDWDRLHDEGTHGAHHARVVGFLRAHAVQVVLVDHVGDGMRRMLATMGIDLREGVRGDARSAALAAAADRADGGDREDGG